MTKSQIDTLVFQHVKASSGVTPRRQRRALTKITPGLFSPNIRALPFQVLLRLLSSQFANLAHGA